MKLKRGLFSPPKLYVILDGQACKNKILGIAKKSIEGGADIIQYRDKNSSLKSFAHTAKKLKAICRVNQIPFIINDNIAAAKIVDADGLHLGQNDLPVSIAKRLMKNKLVGVSCRNVDDAKSAVKQEVDYLGVGSIFKTSTKKYAKTIHLNLFKSIKSLGLPIFAIGGINKHNLSSLRKSKIYNIVVCSAICKSKDPCKAAKTFKKSLLN